MTASITSPLTGGAQTGFTSPTYTLVDDFAPDASNGKQKVVTAVGGTQAGVVAHSVASPFTITISRPKQLKMLPPVGNNGQVAAVPNNTYKVIVRKGVTPAANQASRLASATVEINVPAGSDTYDPANVRAMLSALIGALSQVSAGLGDTAVSGVL